MDGFKFDYGWRKKDLKIFLGRAIEFEIVIDSYTESDKITENQKNTYIKVEKIFENIMNESLDKIKTYYRDECIGCNKEEILDNINLVDLIVFDSVENDRVIGLTFDCKWDEENGIGIKLKNEEILEVGSQDIVL